jgi:hypothetical protein
MEWNATNLPWWCFGLMTGSSRVGVKMGKVSSETTLEKLGTGSKFTFGGHSGVAVSPSLLRDLSKPFNTIKKVVR